MTILTSNLTLGERISNRLADSVGRDRFNLWFDTATLDVRQGVVEITVPNRFTANWIERHFQPKLQDAAAAELGDGAQVQLRIHDAVAATAEPDADAAPPTAAPRTRREPARRATHAGRLRHRLDDFVVGPGNELAYCSACTIAGLDAPPFRTLFIHGGCGLGKTHLLHGICRRYAKLHAAARWRYTSAEQFTNEYIASVRNNQLTRFRSRLRQLDLLVVDDVHFLANKTATQTEFLHTFNDAIDQHGARVVLASDAEPKVLKQFSAALISRFVSGMVAMIHPPDAVTRRRIIEAVARRRQLTLGDSVLDLVTQRTEGSVREIEGLLTKLEALARVELTRQGKAEGDAPHVVIGHAIADRLFDHAPSRGPIKPVRFETIIRVVCDHLQIERATLLGPSRHRRIVLARSLAIHLARTMTTLSYPELARELKRSNHSTICTAAKRVAAQIEAGQTVTLDASLTPVALADLLATLRHRITDHSRRDG